MCVAHTFLAATKCGHHVKNANNFGSNITTQRNILLDKLWVASKNEHASVNKNYKFLCQFFSIFCTVITGIGGMIPRCRDRKRVLFAISLHFPPWTRERSIRERGVTRPLTKKNLFNFQCKNAIKSMSLLQCYDCQANEDINIALNGTKFKYWII